MLIQVLSIVGLDKLIFESCVGTMSVVVVLQYQMQALDLDSSSLASVLLLCRQDNMKREEIVCHAKTARLKLALKPRLHL